MPYFEKTTTQNIMSMKMYDITVSILANLSSCVCFRQWI